MGHKIYIAYEEAQNPSTPCREFFAGLFAGTLGFMTTIGGWLISLFCYFGLTASLSAFLAIGLSVVVGVVFGASMARGCATKPEEICKTKQ